MNLLQAELYQKLFASCGNLGGRRFAATILAGLDMALWDLAGKAASLPVHALLGGAVRDEIRYFGFPQGETPEAVAEDAREWARRGCEVIYVKVGRGAELDVEIVRQVRAAIGGRRLRLDANEVWDRLTALRMIRAFEPFGVEFLEQPTPAASPAALRSVRERSAIPIAADQSVYSPGDAYEVCRSGGADLIVLGLHEAGGMSAFLKCAGVAEAAGVKVCLHGLYESGVTTCATLQAGALIANLDDGNQFMNHLLVEDIVAAPSLSLEQGRLPVPSGPGLGFELDWDAVARAEERHNRQGR
jgi:muconate cycloisomerase